jgi:hypothetical protein
MLKAAASQTQAEGQASELETDEVLDWQISPSYFKYKNCVCKEVSTLHALPAMLHRDMPSQRTIQILDPSG